MVSSDGNRKTKTIIILCAFAVFKICYAAQNKKMYPYRECIPRYHYWQPFYGTIPNNAFRAGVDKSGEVKYVARIVSSDNRVWSTPTTFSETIAKNMWLFFGWQGNTENTVTRYIEVMCVNNPNHGYTWYHVKSREDVYDYERDCCLVEGGYSYMQKIVFDAYIGRTYDHGSCFVGGVYIHDWTSRDYMHYMDGWQSKYIEGNYQILAYDCCKKAKCVRPNSFYDPCCADYSNRRRSLQGFVR